MYCAMSDKRKHPKTFMFYMSEEEWQTLTEAAEKWQTTKADLLRRLVHLLPNVQFYQP